MLSRYTFTIGISIHIDFDTNVGVSSRCFRHESFETVEPAREIQSFNWFLKHKQQSYTLILNSGF